MIDLVLSNKGEERTETQTKKEVLYWDYHAICLKMNDISVDFVGDHEEYIAKNDNYISDSFSEYADGSTSIYYSEQKNFYFENEDICLSALEEYGYTGQQLGELLEECGGLDELICKAGAIGEYSQIYNNLSEDEENIIVCLAIAYLLNNWEQFPKLETMTTGEIFNLCESVADEQIDTFAEIAEHLESELLEDEEGEK